MKNNTPSVLTRLPDRSALSLPLIAIRKPRYGRTYNDKRAIRHVVDTQIVKIAAICLSVIFAKSVYNDFGNLGLMLIPAAFLLGFVLDYFRWDAEFEKLLIRELDARRLELGIASLPQQSSLEKLSVRGEVQNVSALREWSESDMEWTQDDIDDYEGLCSRMNAMAAKGEQLLDKIKKQEPDFATKHFGKFIQVNIETGEYILANSLPEATDEFSRRFGAGSPCFEEHIGHQIYARNPFGNIHAS